jgi:hypothetical protein
LLTASVLERIQGNWVRTIIVETLRAISAELAAQGHLNENGRPFAAASIASMLAG